MIFYRALNTVDRVTSLATLIEEIKAFEILDESNRALKIERLKSICFDIDSFINRAVEYAKTTYLKEERIYLLIEHSKRLKEIQKAFEIELLSLGSKRDFQNEYELKTAFDFELDPIKPTQLLPNAIEIENRIKRAIKNHDFETIKPYKDKAWFKIGVLLATGELKAIHIENGKNATKTTMILVDKVGIKKTDRPYISDSIYNSGKTKNIHKRLGWMEKIIQHCREKEFIIDPSFTEEYNKIRQKNT